MITQKNPQWEVISDQNRKIPKCKACMAVRRTAKEHGYGPIYCMDCQETLQSAKIRLVSDPNGKPLYLETVYPGTEQKRPCRECGRMTTQYRYCNDCHHLESEMDDFIHMNIE